MKKGALIFSTPDWNELLPRGLPTSQKSLGGVGEVWRGRGDVYKRQVQARSGAVHLGHARDVVAGLKAEFFGETLAHFEAVRLGTENDLLKCDLVAQIVALHFLGKEEGH